MQHLLRRFNSKNLAKLAVVTCFCLALQLHRIWRKFDLKRVAEGDAFDPHDFNMPPPASCILAWLYYALLGR
jgi:hypothetical protein